MTFVLSIFIAVILKNHDNNENILNVFYVPDTMCFSYIIRLILVMIPWGPLHFTDD